MKKGGIQGMGGLRGMTLVEVLVTTVVLGIGFAGLFTLVQQSLSVVKQAHNSGAASQVLQQRIEALRLSPFNSVATASNLRGLMQTATQGESEMRGVRNLTETVTVSTFSTDGSPPAQSFTVKRINGSASTTSVANLSSSGIARLNLSLTWNDRNGEHRRELSGVISEEGLNAKGISKEPSLGTGIPSSSSGATPTPAPSPGASPSPTPSPTPAPSPSPTPSPTPTATPDATPWPPATCRHGRPWPHCGTP